MLDIDSDERVPMLNTVFVLAEVYDREMAKMNQKKGLPWKCPDHPNGQIRESWDEKHYILNGHRAGRGVKSNYRWECADCGRELKADK